MRKTPRALVEEGKKAAHAFFFYIIKFQEFYFCRFAYESILKYPHLRSGYVVRLVPYPRLAVVRYYSYEYYR